MHPPVMLEVADAGAFREIFRRFENPFLDQVRFDVFGHGKGEASDLAAALNGKLETSRSGPEGRGIKARSERLRNSGSACGRAEPAPEQGRRKGRAR